MAIDLVPYLPAVLAAVGLRCARWGWNVTLPHCGGGVAARRAALLRFACRTYRRALFPHPTTPAHPTIPRSALYACRGRAPLPYVYYCRATLHYARITAAHTPLFGSPRRCKAKAPPTGWIPLPATMCMAGSTVGQLIIHAFSPYLLCLPPHTHPTPFTDIATPTYPTHTHAPPPPLPHTCLMRAPSSLPG